jgi:SAM-dependent methyltransferase
MDSDMGSILATWAGTQESVTMGAEEGGIRGYLCVDDFLGDMVGARALASALELGLVDCLLERQPRAMQELGAHAKLDERGTRLLAGLLRVHGAIEVSGDAVRLSDSLSAALRYRDLLEAKLDFAAAVAPDYLDLFTTLLADPAGFFERAKLFDLFSYDRCFEPTPENVSRTARWMRFTTALTRYEAAGCLDHHDFSAYSRMLDVGGNSGEFALRACRRHPGLRATVCDLPVVCGIGARHVAAEPEAGRIDFVEADAADGALPQGHDLVTFKSMLHDWPDEPMRAFLARAHAALAPGGTVLIYERGPVEIGEGGLAYGQVPLMLFFRSYRTAPDYAAALAQAGFRDISVKTVELDMPFLLVSAKK